MTTERDIKHYFLKRLGDRNCLFRKVVWENRRGAPDWCVMHKGTTHWVELKSPTGKVSKLQSWEFKKFALNGVRVHVLSTFDKVDQFIKECIDL